MAFTKRQLDALRYDAERGGVQLVWDGDLPGFGVRVMPSGTRTFILDYRNAAGRKRRVTLGRYGTLTVDQARRMARDTLHDVRRGADPLEEKRQARLEAERAITWDAFAPIYIENARTRGNPGRRTRRPKKTWRSDQYRIEKHILPAWGRRRLDEVTRADVKRLFADIAKPFEANRVLALVSIMFRSAVDLGYLPDDHPNPAHGVVMHAETKRDRFVTEDEMPALMKAIADADDVLRRAVLLYLLTGLRRAELCRLTWKDIDMKRGRLRLGTTKNGEPHYLPLSTAALDVLRSAPRAIGEARVVPLHPDVMSHRWAAVRESAGIADVRLHDLRRTVGSWLAMDGNSLPLIGAVLNHRSSATTEIYARFHTEAAREALENHGNRIAAIMQKVNAG